MRENPDEQFSTIYRIKTALAVPSSSSITFLPTFDFKFVIGIKLSPGLSEPPKYLKCFDHETRRSSRLARLIFILCSLTFTLRPTAIPGGLCNDYHR